jgi:hypothetical protein
LDPGCEIPDSQDLDGIWDGGQSPCQAEVGSSTPKTPADLKEFHSPDTQHQSPVSPFAEGEPDEEPDEPDEDELSSSLPEDTQDAWDKECEMFETGAMDPAP